MTNVSILGRADNVIFALAGIERPRVIILKLFNVGMPVDVHHATMSNQAQLEHTYSADMLNVTSAIYNRICWWIKLRPVPTAEAIRAWRIFNL